MESLKYRNDKNGILHVIIGNTSFSEQKITENFLSMYDFLLKINLQKPKELILNQYHCVPHKVLVYLLNQ